MRVGLAMQCVPHMGCSCDSGSAPGQMLAIFTFHPVSVNLPSSSSRSKYFGHPLS